MVSRSLLIADLHLSKHSHALLQRFLQMAEVIAASYQRLYILGDLFDLYIGEDQEDTSVSTVLATLKRLSQAGVAVFVQRGNRDLLLGGSFFRQSGVKLLPDYYVADFSGHKILLMHGDFLCTQDKAHLRFRHLMNTNAMRALIRSTPLFFRRRLARLAKRVANKHKHNKARNIMDVEPTTVIRIMRQYGVKTLIHGHTHLPKIHSVKTVAANAKRIVLGDWGKHYWWVDIQEGQATLAHALLTQPFTTSTG